MELSETIERELTDLARRYGAPLMADARIADDFNDPIRRKDRYGEVCMVVRRPNGNVLLSIKTFYPRGAYRLPTGGIHEGEPVYDALLRETHEETGLDTTVERFLAQISYRGTAPRAKPFFHTFAFLLRETGGTLGALDLSEQLEDWREIDPSELPRVADTLDDLRTTSAHDIGGDWRAWGKFRAIVHRAVHQAMTV